LILRLKYTKFDFGWGSIPDPAGGAHPIAQFKEPTSNGGKDREGKGKGKRR